jgi:hypothetical protein
MKEEEGKKLTDIANGLRGRYTLIPRVGNQRREISTFRRFTILLVRTRPCSKV